MSDLPPIPQPRDEPLPDFGPILGFEQSGPQTEVVRRGPWGDYGREIVVDPGETPIYGDTVFEAVRALDDMGRRNLALEMFIADRGAYSDIDDVFNDDYTVNELAFVNAVGQTVGLAGQFGPGQLVENPMYLDILMGDTEQSAEELVLKFQQRAAALKAASAGGGGGGGRVINYIDPVALQDAAKNGFAAKTGRKATKAEQQAFVKTIHSLQASGATGIDVSGRAGAFAESSAPVEAAAMDHVTAARSVLSVLGIGG